MSESILFHSNPPTPPPTVETADQALLQLERLASDRGPLAADAESEQRFYREALRVFATLAGAEGATLWRGGEGALLPAIRYPDPPAPESDPSTRGATPIDSHTRSLIEQAARSGRPSLVRGRRARSGAAGPVTLACPLAKPLGSGGPERGAAAFCVLVCHPAVEVTDATSHRLLSFAMEVAGIVEQFRLRRQVERTNRLSGVRASIDAFLLRLHGNSRAPYAAQAVAEEGKRLLACDRLAVLSRRGGRWTVAAVSSVVEPAERSTIVRAMRRLVKLMLAASEGAVYSGSEMNDPILLAEADRYLELSGSRQFAVIPCAPPRFSDGEQGSAAGRRGVSVALLAEQFEGLLPKTEPIVLESLAPHAAIAIGRGRSRGGGARSRLTGALLSIVTLALVAATAYALTLVRAPLTVTAEGRFLPVTRTRVYAPLDASVQEVLAGHGASVEAGQPLLKLQSVELALQMQEARASLTNTLEEIKSLETAKLRATLPGFARDADVSAIASEVEVLRKRIAYDKKRIALLKLQRERLTILSPHGGRVTSWDPNSRLSDRPVQRGQRLLEVASDEQGWKIEAEAYDRHAGGLLKAWRKQGELGAEYVIKSDPSERHRARVIDVASVTQLNESGQATVRFEALPEDPRRLAPREGMTLLVKVHCGERPLGYVWFHEAWEELQRRWF